MFELIIEGLKDLAEWGIKTAIEAAQAKSEAHEAILTRVQAMRAARDGERTPAHEETLQALADAQAEIDRLKAAKT
jgi:hypothetical protein